MSVKTASKLVVRAMRAAITETISPANQGTKLSSRRRPLTEAGRVSREFCHELHQQQDAYSGMIDEVGSLGGTADSWRLEFSKRGRGLTPANGRMAKRKRQA